MYDSENDTVAKCSASDETVTRGSMHYLRAGHLAT